MGWLLHCVISRKCWCKSFEFIVLSLALFWPLNGRDLQKSCEAPRNTLGDCVLALQQIALPDSYAMWVATENWERVGYRLPHKGERIGGSSPTSFRQVTNKFIFRFFSSSKKAACNNQDEEQSKQISTNQKVVCYLWDDLFLYSVNKVEAPFRVIRRTVDFVYKRKYFWHWLPVFSL